MTEPLGRLGVQIDEEHLVIEIGSHGRRVSVPGPAADLDARVH